MDYQSIVFGQKHKNFTYDDFELVNMVSRLAKKHQKLAEYSCNGVGWIRGVCYYNGAIDDWARRTYGQGVKSAYVGDDETVFDLESSKIEDKIFALLGLKVGKGLTVPAVEKWRVEFQGDPRGNTVKLFYEGDFIEL
jgi:hypothetical protein